MDREALPEAYAKVKHQRDQVVEAFNKLKERQRDLEEELADLLAAARGFAAIYYCDESSRRLGEALKKLEELI